MMAAPSTVVNLADLPVTRALQYAAIGWAVLPIRAGSKVPHLDEWQHRASADPSTIREWWSRWPRAGIGVHCGLSGVVVVDVDPRNGGRDTFARLEAERGPLWDHDPAIARTGGGGWHYVFAAPEGVRLPAKLGPGVDLLSGLRYFLAEPSVHPVTGKPYRWENGANPLNMRELPPLPEAWWTAAAEVAAPTDAAGLDALAQLAPAPLEDTPANRERVKSAAAALSADCDYHEWMRRTFAILSTGLPDAVEIAREWSMTAPGRFDDDAFDLLVDSYKEERRHGGDLIGPGTLFHLAKEAGWTDPRKTGEVDDLWGQPFDIRQALTVEPEPIAWLIDERIQTGRAILVTGVGGSSKTRFIYHLALGCAVGRLPWPWPVKRTGKSVLVLTEDSPDDVARTLHAMCRAMGLNGAEIDAVADSVIAFPLAGRDVRLLTFSDSRELIKNAHFTSLEAAIRALGDVVFIALDPALSLTPGEENDQGHQRALGKMADDLAIRTGAAVCLVSHASKGSLQRDELESHNSRGGGAITDAVRGEFSMRAMTAKEAKAFGIADIEERKRYVQLVATKGNHLPPGAFAPTWLRRGEGGVLEAANLVPGDAEEPRLSAADLQAHEILVELCKSGSPRIGEWRAECVARGVIPTGSPSAVEKTMQRIVDRLVAGWLVVRGEVRGVYLPLDPDTG